MAGGTYHDHNDMETLLDLGALTSSSEPITDAAMDAITVLIEGYAEGAVKGATGKSLSDCTPASARKAMLMAMSAKYYKHQQGVRSGAASRVTPASSVTYSFSGVDMTPEVRTLIRLAGQETDPLSVVKSVDTNKRSW